MIDQFNELLSNITRGFNFESPQVPFQRGALSVVVHDFEHF